MKIIRKSSFLIEILLKLKSKSDDDDNINNKINSIIKIQQESKLNQFYILK